MPLYQYSRKKEKNLIDIYNQASAYFSENTIDSTSDFFIELQKIDSTRNIEIVVSDKNNDVVFTSSNNFLKSGFLLPMQNGNTPRDIKAPINDDKEPREFPTQKIFDSLSNDNPYTTNMHLVRKEPSSSSSQHVQHILCYTFLAFIL